MSTQDTWETPQWASQLLHPEAPSKPIEEGPPVNRSDYVLGIKQIAALGFVTMTLITVVACISYTVGRISFSPMQSTPTEVTSHPTEASSHAEKVMVINPPEPVSPQQTSRMEPGQGIHSQVAATPVARNGQTSNDLPANGAQRPHDPATVDPPPQQRNAAGQLFYQIAAVNLGMANVSLEYLKKNGLEGQLVPSGEPGIFRVLIGPLGGSDQIESTRTALESAGFKPFLRRQ